MMYLTVRQEGGAHDGPGFFQPWRAIMKPSARLKLATVFFIVFWTAAMLWWSGSLEWANIITTAIGGAVAGYSWYRFMRWQ